MKAMIFAAGLGTRLKPLTDNTPKALIPINGKPMLEHVILKLKDAGFHQIAINIHHLGDQIIDFLAANNNFGVQIYLSDERDYLLDTGGGIKHAAAFLQGNEPFLIHNVDIMSNIDLRALYNHHLEMNPLASVNAIPPVICFSIKKTNYAVGATVTQVRSNLSIRTSTRINTTNMRSAAYMSCRPKYSTGWKNGPGSSLSSTSTCPSVPKQISMPMRTTIFACST